MDERFYCITHGKNIVMKKIFISTLILVAFIATSCENLLEEEVYGQPTAEEMLSVPENVAKVVGELQLYLLMNVLTLFVSQEMTGAMMDIGKDLMITLGLLMTYRLSSFGSIQIQELFCVIKLLASWMESKVHLIRNCICNLLQN